MYEPVKFQWPTVLYIHRKYDQYICIDASSFTREVANSTSGSTGHHVAVTITSGDGTVGNETGVEILLCDLFMVASV